MKSKEFLEAEGPSVQFFVHLFVSRGLARCRLVSMATVLLKVHFLYICPERFW